MTLLGRSPKLQFIVIATIMGNLLQWFDFSLFGLMLPLFSKLFFPGGDPAFFFLLFSIGAFARPLGGVVFGYLGDTIGRKTALVRTILFMTIPILLVALLPTAKDIGPIAGIFLLLLYLFQGFCVGGEFPGSVIFLTESAPQNLRGYIGSWAYFGVSFGVLLVALDVYELNDNLTPLQLETWGWRIPFFMGALVGVIGIFMRHFLHETPIFSEAKHVGHLVKRPLWSTFTKHKRMLLKGMGVFLIDSFGFNLVLIFSNFYYYQQFHLSLKDAFQINIFSIVLTLVFLPLMGRIGNGIGNIKLAKIAAWAIVLLAYPIYLYIERGSLLNIYIGQGLLVFLISSYVCNLPNILYHMYPTEVRYTCFGLVMNFTVAIFGGTAPLFVHLLMDWSGSNAIPGMYLMAGALISCLSLNRLKKAF